MLAFAPFCTGKAPPPAHGRQLRSHHVAALVKA